VSLDRGGLDLARARACELILSTVSNLGFVPTLVDVVELGLFSCCVAVWDRDLVVAPSGMIFRALRCITLVHTEGIIWGNV